ncbi:hypothetical protein AVEN_171835-1 [Araneus ventricosus]|uniref:Uncharacterized protein n=1 Tax=Araneus ventricosus TaxID=182803 RepID=A0A4Y2QAY8_ARAVE|nr:hypothetical protein AVEN_171835-1 [Araneus ventricosus]
MENVSICTFVATDDADVHIVKTGIETNEKIKKQVVVIGQDVDILVLLTALTPTYTDILMLKEGKGKVKDRFSSSKEMQNSNLEIECKKSILFVHAISGCDTTSRFYRKGKLQAVQLLILFRQISSFFVLLYNAMMNLSPALSISVEVDLGLLKISKISCRYLLRLNNCTACSSPIP